MKLSTHNNLYKPSSHFNLESSNIFDDSYADNHDKFPEKGLKRLIENGCFLANVPKEFGGWGWGNASHNIQLLKLLKYIGRHDLSLGRLFEGHVNALLLIDRFGSETQKAYHFDRVMEGRLYGIWNSELPSNPLKFRKANDNYYLEGSKVFCSGANEVSYPIVTAMGDAGSQMIILDFKSCNLDEDYTYWQPIGMKASVSCRFDFSGMCIKSSQLLGKAYDYVSEPDFSGGASRFAAVQLGGAHAAIEATLEHLNYLKRSSAPEQIARIARLTILDETGSLWLNRAGEAMDNRHKNPEQALHYANMFRTIVREICEEVLKICEMAVGLQGMMKPHPLERIHRDLSVYLKQPGPDRTFNAIGAHVLNN